MARHKKDREAKQKRRRLDAYKRRGKTLAPPLMNYLQVSPLEYDRQLLPQLLWLESVVDRYGEKKLPGLVHRFLDLMDALGTTGSDPVSGMVESFLFVPEAKRAAFVHDHRDAVQAMVIEPFGPALLLYGDCPMKWLMDLYGRANCQLDLV